MSRWKGSIAFLAVFLLAFAVWAGDPWKEKSYKDWNEKDLQRIFNDSPWAKPVSVSKTWKSGGGGGKGQGPTRDRTADSGPTTMRGQSEGEYGVNIPSAPGPRTDANEPRLPEAVFMVRWTSSRALRQALARRNLLMGKPATEVEKIVALEPLVHELVIFGEDMTPFTQVTDAELREKSHLTLKQSKREVPAMAAAIRKSEDGKQVIAVVFHFPKKSETGEAALPASEKAVEFHCQAGKTSIKANFDLQKMATKEGPEFR